MKYKIFGGVLILSAIWGGAFGMELFESTAYDIATYLTACMLLGVGSASIAYEV